MELRYYFLTFLEDSVSAICRAQEIEPELAGIVLKVRPDLDPVLSCQNSFGLL